MTKQEMEMIERIDEIKSTPFCAEDLKPFLKDRTLLYGYTCDRKTFHVYLKDQEIHTVIYDIVYEEKDPNPINMVEVHVKSNRDYIPDKRLYPETCDYLFCKLLKNVGVHLPFTTFNDDRPIQDFYGFTLQDMKEAFYA